MLYGDDFTIWEHMQHGWQYPNGVREIIRFICEDDGVQSSDVTSATVSYSIHRDVPRLQLHVVSETQVAATVYLSSVYYLLTSVLKVNVGMNPPSITSQHTYPLSFQDYGEFVMTGHCIYLVSVPLVAAMSNAEYFMYMLNREDEGWR